MHSLLLAGARLLFPAAIALIVPTAARAADLYVCHAGGDDTRTKADAGSARTPWATIGRAAWGSPQRDRPNPTQAANAGDTVLVCAGSYATAGTGQRYEPAYNPVNTGAPGRAIVFQAQGPVTLSLSSSRGPVIGVYRRDYVTWKGFTVDERSAPSRGDTGPAVMWMTTGSGIEDSVLIGDARQEVLIADNHPGIRTVEARLCVIRNNRISGFRNHGNNPINASGIQTYGTDGITIEHNEIWNSGAGIFLKANYGTGEPFTFTPQNSNWIRFNLIHDVGTGIAVHVNPTPPGHATLVHQNIVRDVTTALHIRTFGRATHEPRRVMFVNNTVHNTANAGFYVNSAAEFVAEAGHVLWNNIFTESRGHVVLAEMSAIGSFDDPTKFDSQHNLFRNFQRFASVGQAMSLSDWQRQLSQDVKPPKSTTKDPEYLNSAAGDFHLKPGSSARDIGRAIRGIGGPDGSVIPAGAYITGFETIGTLSGTSAGAKVSFVAD